ncbi:MAG: LysR substrate-binding domain-containing protein [Shinella sp.]|uniref:LysR substrate-binding domain-containing protein n=2 Tax=Shinella sp. TaxID=1870904 RepID=UPI0040352F5D
MHLPSLNALRVFEATARLGSLKAAAAELALSPSAVSRHIGSLEDTLGAKLFVRGVRSVTLTSRGESYAHRLREAFRIIETATEEAAVHMQVRRGRSHIITLGGESTFISLWLADRLEEFHRLHPELDFEVSTSSDNDIGNADLFIFSEFENHNDPSFKPLLPLTVLPVCAPSLAQGEHPIREVADLVAHRLLHEGTTAWWEEWLAREGTAVASTANRGAIFHDAVLLMREAIKGGGVALADTIMAEDFLRRGELVAPLPNRHKVSAGYYLRQRAGAGGKQGIRPFRDWLTSKIEEHKRFMRLS